MAEIVVQIVISGLLVGGVYALLAGGLNLIFGVMKVINLAHGELMMLSGFSAWYVWHWTGWSPLAIVPIVAPAMFLVGVVLQRTIVQSVVGKPELTSLLVTFGISIFLANAGLLLFTADFKSIPYWTTSFFLQDLGEALPNIAVSQSRLVAFTVAATATMAVYLFLKLTRFGKAVRATSQHSDVAMVCGIDVERVRLFTFGLGAALAGVAGVLLVTIFAVDPLLGHRFLLRAFAIIVIGGMGSYMGALAGGLILGVAEGLAAFFLTTQLSEAVAYVLLIVVLLVKPSGLLGLGSR
jgi:branched-chain amino acid transport system permease protein